MIFFFVRVYEYNKIWYIEKYILMIILEVVSVKIKVL